MRLALEAEVNIVAGFDHLLGFLSKMRLVAIDRRNPEYAGHESDQRGYNQHKNCPPVRAHSKIENRGKALCRPKGPRQRTKPRTELRCAKQDRPLVGRTVSVGAAPGHPHARGGSI